MTKILIPANSADEWQRFLAEPGKQWKTGYSAKAIAHCWKEAGGIPPEIKAVLGQVSSLHNLKTIFAIPEHKVPLPGGTRASQNDVWVLAETNDSLVSIAVEGKVSESFDVTVGEWFTNPSPGKQKRLQYLCDQLCLDFPPPDHIRYQLLHRTASAIIEAKRFKTNTAVMVVHTFSPTNEWLEDFQNYIALYGLEAGVDEAVSVQLPSGVNLHLAWVHGDEKFLSF